MGLVINRVSNIQAVKKSSRVVKSVELTSQNITFLQTLGFILGQNVQHRYSQRGK